MSASALSTNTSPTVEEQLDIALQRAAIEDILSASGTYLTACVAIYGWDFILTFPDEYKTMWKADRWTSAGRLMRGLCSFWGLLVIVYARCLLWLEFDPKTCDKIHLIGPAATTLLFLSCQFLLGARVWVMWNCRKWIAWFVGTLAICSTALQILAFTTSKALPLLPGLRGCISTRGDKK
ncbi:hypothetical protein BT69DRAFT_1359215 [Atractiella rhizophila]|nr:hypothetical protein BT69DRAFT_1359215 [Atractiella rhizophila]